jgi:hypothetical protein
MVYCFNHLLPYFGSGDISADPVKTLDSMAMGMPSGFLPCRKTKLPFYPAYITPIHWDNLLRFDIHKSSI